MIRLPPKEVFSATYRTTVLAWLVLRGIVGMYGGSPSVLLRTSVFLMFGVAMIAVVDMTVARERLLLGNLGVGRWEVAAISLLGCMVLEFVSGAVVRLAGLGG